MTYSNEGQHNLNYFSLSFSPPLLILQNTFVKVHRSLYQLAILQTTHDSKKVLQQRYATKKSRKLDSSFQTLGSISTWDEINQNYTGIEELHKRLKLTQTSPAEQCQNSRILPILGQYFQSANEIQYSTCTLSYFWTRYKIPYTEHTKMTHCYPSMFDINLARSADEVRKRSSLLLSVHEAAEFAIFLQRSNNYFQLRLL